MEEKNVNARLEAFCDGVFAIALTLLIIDIRPPSGEHIKCTNDLWKALAYLTPSIFAFLLSFCIILISWVAHHSTMKLVGKSTHPFIYANAFLLLTIVFFPFPTALLAENILTDHAVPAVVIYSSLCLLTNIAWIILLRVALNPKQLLAKSESAVKALKDLQKNTYAAFIIYASCTVAAFWFPKTIAAILTFTWLLWLITNINIKEKNTAT